MPCEFVVQARQFSSVLLSAISWNMQVARLCVGRPSGLGLQFSDEIAFAPQAPRLTQISGILTGDLYIFCCTTSTDGWQMQTHSHSNDHRRRMFNHQSQVDFFDSSALCSICNEPLDERHRSNVNDIQCLIYYVSQFGSFSLLDAMLALPPPSPPPSVSSNGCAMFFWSISASSQSQIQEVSQSAIVDHAQTYCGGFEDVSLAWTHVWFRLLFWSTYLGPILTSTLWSGKHTRARFPIVAGFSMTVNKSQGLTIKEGIVVNLRGSANNQTRIPTLFSVCSVDSIGNSAIESEA